MILIVESTSLVQSNSENRRLAEVDIHQRSKAIPGGSISCKLGVWTLTCLTALCLTLVRCAGQDPRFPPGHNFDLSHWYLTLPDANASTISPPQLTAGFTNAHFETGADGAMLFLCPVTGGTTIGSDFPRCELRELLDTGDYAVNWPGYGRHVLSAQCKVLQLPSSRRVVIGQIHSYLGDAPPLIKLSYNNGVVEALVRLQADSSSDTRLPLTTVGLSNAINYEITLQDGLLSITVNGVTRSTNVFGTDPAWKQQIFYFKAGNYCQDNAGPTNEIAIVGFYQLSAQHSPPSVITSFSANTQSFCLTWSSLPGSSYYVQGVTNLGSTNWVKVSPYVEALGDFASHCIALPSPYQYFRVAVRTP